MRHGCVLRTMKTKEGLWKLSPSGLYGFEECKACFWLQNIIGRHPFTLPLRLNDAMDEKLKNRYDSFRKNGTVPPEITQIKGIKLFDDFRKLNEWRNYRTALRYTNNKDGYMLEGKLDEVFVGPAGELIPADYKSSGDPPKEDKQKYYRLQLTAYALILREQGYRIGNKAYLLHYFTKDRADPSLFMELDFHADEVPLNIPQFEETMREIVKLLNSNYPGRSEECQRCMWLERVKQN